MTDHCIPGAKAGAIIGLMLATAKGIEEGLQAIEQREKRDLTSADVSKVVSSIRIDSKYNRMKKKHLKAQYDKVVDEVILPYTQCPNPRKFFL